MGVGVVIYLSGARCRLFAYGPTDATAFQNHIISCLLNPNWFYLSGTQVVLEKRPLNGCSSNSSSSSTTYWISAVIVTLQPVASV